MPVVTVQSDFGAQENKIHLFLYLLESHPFPKVHAYAIFFITIWMSLLNLSLLIYLKSWSCFVSLYFVLLFFFFFSFENLQVLSWQGKGLTNLSNFSFFFFFPCSLGQRSRKQTCEYMPGLLSRSTLYWLSGLDQTILALCMSLHIIVLLS